MLLLHQQPATGNRTHRLVNSEHSPGPPPASLSQWGPSVGGPLANGRPVLATTTAVYSTLYTRHNLLLSCGINQKASPNKIPPVHQPAIKTISLSSYFCRRSIHKNNISTKERLNTEHSNGRLAEAFDIQRIQDSLKVFYILNLV